MKNKRIKIVPDILEEAPLLERLSLRSYQRDAVHTARKYVASYRSAETKGSGLVHMATGTGKTGIIAALARCTPEIQAVLVLAPRVALCEQLQHDIEKRFFESLDRTPPLEEIPKKIVTMEDLLDDVQEDKKTVLRDKVIVSTIQMVESMARNTESPSIRQKRKQDLFRRLTTSITLVLIDEGHYEPATAWSDALRQIRAPRILFTATPYRNDFKQFDFDFRFASHFTLSQATQENYIRHVKVVRRKSSANPRDFIRDVMEFYENEMKRKSPNARVIIRCDNANSIAQMAEVMEEQAVGFVAIHDRFKDKGGRVWERRTVPKRKPSGEEDPYYDESGPKFWIHQFKLLEGIDDNRFRAVAIFEPLTNARQVVQQVGRIIRNPKYPASGTAFLLDHTDGYHEKEWGALFQHDDEIARGSGESQSLQGNFVHNILEAHPQTAYIDGTVRYRFQFPEFKPPSDLKLPLAANLVDKPKDFRIERLTSNIEKRLAEADHVYRRYEGPDDRTVVFFYVSVANVPFLENSYFLDSSPGVIVARELENRISYYDSSGTTPFGLDGLGRAENPDHLRRLFSRRTGSRLIEVASKNAQLGHRAIRARALSAASLEETIPALDDHAQVVTRVRGYSIEMIKVEENGREVKSRRRRYIGFRFGRVVESGPRASLGKYIAWLGEIGKILDSRRHRLPTFGRYALEAGDVKEPEPQNVLLDVFEIEDQYKTLGNEKKKIAPNEPMMIDDVCKNVAFRGKRGSKKAGHFFTVRANGHTCDVLVLWDAKRKRYELVSRDLGAMYIRDGGGPSLLDYLNTEQSFRILPKSDDVIYIDGEFYHLTLPVGSRFNKERYHVGKILRTNPRLKELTDEKGQRCTPRGGDWDADCLFGLISRGCKGNSEMERAFARADTIICDDMGTEVADFIMSDRDHVIFLHMKGNGESEAPGVYSAGKISYVCAQAAKNIRFLSMFNTQPPKHLDRWAKRWSSPKTTKGFVSRRILRGSGSPRVLWQTLRERISNPVTTREVWIVLGGILSKGGLEEQLGANKPAPEAIQAVTLLHSTLAAVGSIDAKLMVFCHP